MTEQPLVPLLRAFVHGSEPPAQALPETLLATAQLQNLLPVLAYMNSKWKLSQDPALTQELGRSLRQSIFLHNIRYAQFEQVSAMLSENGIDHMPVKGWYLRSLYPEPELRTFGDIDVLIRREDREKAHALMTQAGFAVKENWEPTYTYARETELYEFHTNLMDASLDGRSDLPAYFADAWSHAAIDHGRCWKPGLEFHLLYVICHLAKHLYSSGAGLRMYLDAALYIKTYNDSLDWTAIRAEMEQLGLGRFLDTVLTACESWFGVTAACDFSRLASAGELLNYALDADLFGKLRDHSVIQMRNRRETPSSDGKTDAIKRVLFPPYEALVKRYTYIQGRKWLMPVALLHRAAVNLANIPGRAKQLRAIAETDRESVDAYDDFMTRIGL